MADNKISTPSGMGGLQRFDEEYSSKLQFKPEWLLVAIGVFIAVMTVIKVIY